MDINASLKEWEDSPSGILIDVRNPEEYRSGHIPGSRNIPLREIPRSALPLSDPDTPIFLYCRTGFRSSRAAAILKRLGCTRVRSIGGIRSFSGNLER